ncbi:MAG: ribosome-associated translation inhibitor RaiA [Acidobacteriota bacterium]
MMTVTVTGRHIEIPAATRLQIEKRIGRLHRVLNEHAVSAQCVVTRERLGVACELTVHAKGDHMLVAIGRHARLITAVGEAIEKVSHQAERLADRWKTRKRDRRRPPEPAVEAAPVERVPRVIRTRGYSVKPLSIDDAVMALGEQVFLVFRHTETERVAVLFRRPDGNFGLIDAES